MRSDDYEQEQKEQQERLLRLNEEITKQEEQAENIDRFICKVRKYLDLDELTPAIINDMVKTDMFTRRTSQRVIGNSRLTFPMTLWEYSPRLC